MEIKEIVDTVYNNYVDILLHPSSKSVEKKKIRSLVESLIERGKKVIAVKKPCGDAVVELEEPSILKYSIKSYKVDKEHPIEIEDVIDIVFLYAWFEYPERDLEVIRLDQKIVRR